MIDYYLHNIPPPILGINRQLFLTVGSLVLAPLIIDRQLLLTGQYNVVNIQCYKLSEIQFGVDHLMLLGISRKKCYYDCTLAIIQYEHSYIELTTACWISVLLEVRKIIHLVVRSPMLIADEWMFLVSIHGLWSPFFFLKKKNYKK